MSDNTSQNMNDKQAMQALQQYGGNIVLAIAVVLAGYFGWSYFQQNSKASVDTVVADQYLQLNELNQQISNQGNTSAMSEEEKQQLIEQQQAFDSNLDDFIKNNDDNIYVWQALMIKAKQYMDSNEVKSAIPVLKSAMDVTVDDLGLKAIGQLRYAQALLADGQLEEAKKIAIHKVPASFEASQQELLGDIYLAMNDKESATRSYDNAWKLLEKRQEQRNILQLKMESLGMQVKKIEPKALYQTASKVPPVAVKADKAKASESNKDAGQ